jgi:hypothetical protein
MIRLYIPKGLWDFLIILSVLLFLLLNSKLQHMAIDTIKLPSSWINTSNIKSPA